MNTDTLLEIRNLHKYFGQGASQVRAVDDVSFVVHKGEMVLVMGPSGSGKTTLLSLLGALLTPDAGQILVAGRDITTMPEREQPALRARTFGFVFQAFNLLDALDVEHNILLPARLMPGGIRAARPRMEQLLQRLDLQARRRALPKTLSGGEKQRVAIARALINAPPLILADEPTGNLDSRKGQEVLMALYDIAHDEDRAVVIVTHDPRVEDIADHVFWLEDGKLRDRKAEAHQWQTDPVCGMKVDIWQAAYATEHEGKKIHFCSRRCRDRFFLEPERYQPG